ncbi:MAG: TonB family protein [Limnothrix sp.]
MKTKSTIVPTEKALRFLKTTSNYARNPYGIAVIGSIGLHVVAAVALPSWSESDGEFTEGNQEVVRVVELPPDVQSRLPSLSPQIDLSVFEANPDFNIDLSAIENGLPVQPLPPGLEGRIPNLNAANGTFLPFNINNLPTPAPPSRGSVNYSFVPNNNPPAIASRYIAPPPPRNFMNGLLPPPPGVPARTNQAIFNLETMPNNGNASVLPPSPDGNQQVFAINPQAKPNGNNALLQRQRQLEQDAAIALSPTTTFAPNSSDIRFDAALLKPSDLTNPAGLLPRSQGQPRPANNPPTSAPSQQATRSSSIASRSIRGNYPKSACSSQASGTATYNVVVTPNGTPSQWSLNSSSGSNSLDNQAGQDIRNTRFDSANSNYRVSVGYTYQPSFCTAFQAPPSQTKPAAPAPASTPANAPAPAAAPAPQKTPKPAPQETLTIETPTAKPTPPPTQQQPAPAPAPQAPAAPPAAPKPAPLPLPKPKPQPAPAPAPAPVVIPTPAPAPAAPPAATEANPEE